MCNEPLQPVDEHLLFRTPLSSIILMFLIILRMT